MQVCVDVQVCKSQTTGVRHSGVTVDSKRRTADDRDCQHSRAGSRNDAAQRQRQQVGSGIHCWEQVCEQDAIGVLFAKAVKVF